MSMPIELKGQARLGSVYLLNVIGASESTSFALRPHFWDSSAKTLG